MRSWLLLLLLSLAILSIGPGCTSAPDENIELDRLFDALGNTSGNSALEIPAYYDPSAPVGSPLHEDYNQ